jgi:hypothetical protein
MMERSPRNPISPIFAQDLVRQRQIGVGQDLADDLAGDPLMLGIGIGVQEANRDRLDTRILERPASLLDACLPEQRMHLARGQQALVGFQREAPRHQRPVLVEQKVIGLGAVAAADGVDIAGAAGDDQAGCGALALDQRIDGDGRAVDELVDRLGLEAALAQAIDDALNQVGRGGQALGLHEGAGRLVEPDEIRECSADVDGNDQHAEISRRPVL